MKNTARLLILALLALLLLPGYDNAAMHPRINERIILAAIQTLDKSAQKIPKFATWDFDLQGLRLAGPTVTNPGWIPSTVSEGDVEKTPGDWIEDGGRTADEPSFFMALRHFYDPKKIDGGKSWLTNRGARWEEAANNVFFNQRIDAKEWALSHAENPYRWQAAKAFLKQGLEEPDPARRARHFAQAYRGLGETLHLLADLGCPPHVRNDSHAAPCGPACLKVLGNPDPYEALVKPDHATQHILESGGKVLPSLKAKLVAATTASELFETLATFTNESFFTDDTIAGTAHGAEVTPHISDRPAYASPRLDGLEYDENGNVFYKTFENGERVMMARDGTFFGIGHRYPYIDSDVVASQASVLLPQIAEAGVNLMRLFFPDLSVTLDPVRTDGGAIAGKVKHTPDAEHTSSIAYRGKVALFVKFKQQGEVDVDASGGFSFSGVSVAAGDTVYAELTLPGFLIRSEEVVAGSAPKVVKGFTGVVTIYEATGKDKCGSTYTLSNGSPGVTIFKWSDSLQCSGSTCTANWSGQATSGSAKLTLSADQKSVDFELTFDSTDSSLNLNDFGRIISKVTGTAAQSHIDSYGNWFDVSGDAVCSSIKTLSLTADSAKSTCTPPTLTVASHTCAQGASWLSIRLSY